MAFTEDTKHKLLPFQIEPAQAIANCINEYYTTGENQGCMLVQPAGTGKTYEIVAGIKANAQTRSYLPPTFITSRGSYYEGECISTNPTTTKPAKIWIVTPAQVKTQFNRVLASWGITNYMVVSPMSLCTSFGDAFIQWISVFRGNQMQLDPVWDTDMMPDIIILDEAQCVKNKDSQISQLILAFINQGGLVIPVSATPFTRLSETYVICYALKLIKPSGSHIEFFYDNQIINDSDDYYGYNAVAMARFNTYLINHNLKIEAHNVKFPHRVFNKCRLIDFKRPEHKAAYAKAYTNWVIECQKHKRKTPEGIAAIWAAMLKFRQAAELLRVEQMCELAVLTAADENKQVLIASNFVATLDLAQQVLQQIFKVNKSKISIIVGGQNQYVRQSNIDKFQRGDTDFCLLTLKSGGAGLSLHHEREYPKARPRYCILPPTWSAIELVQVLGRAHRITSISTTRQDIIWYRETIEENVALRVQHRMRSMKEIVSKREVWTDLFDPDGNFIVDDSACIKQRMQEEQESNSVDADGISEFDTMAIEAYQDTSDDVVDSTTVMKELDLTI